MSEQNKNIIPIHGKDYMTVAGRIQLAGKDFIGLETEILSSNPVVIKATVLTIKGKFTGISAANPDKAIEKTSPYEVAETSVGRALGFAGFGITDSIATADEMIKAIQVEELPKDLNKVPLVPINVAVKKELGKPCPQCGVGTIVINPNTQKLFCDQKCWTNSAN